MADPGGFKVSTETSLEIDFNPVSLNTLIEQSGRNSLIEQSDCKCYNYNSFIRNNSYVGKKRGMVDDPFLIFLVFNSNWAGVLFVNLKPPFKNPASTTNLVLGPKGFKVCPSCSKQVPIM